MAHFFDQHIAKPIVARLPRQIKANHLSLARALLVAPLIAWRDDPAIAIGILAASSLLDIFDGPIARLRGESSQFGAVLDATGDKVFILGALIFACGDRVALEIRVGIVALDVILTLMRPLKRWLGASAGSNVWGGLKIWAQTITIGLVLIQQPALGALAPYGFAVSFALGALSLYGHIRDCFRRDVTTR